MEWLEYLLFLLTGYMLRVLGEPKKTNKESSFSLPKITTPSEMIRNHKEKLEEQQREKEMNIMLENIDVYDGTANGQKEVG